MQKNKKVYLTFDDGPHKVYTSQVLDILKQEKIKATFFVLGEEALKYPNLVKRIAREGHTIGNHGYDHSYIKTVLGLPGEFSKTGKILENILGFQPKLYRVPFGYLNPVLWLYLSLKGMKHVRWNLVPRDWEITDKNQIIESVIGKTKNNTIVLLHDGAKGTEIIDREHTISALLPIIKTLKSKNYTFLPLKAN
ncbi:polysaccharide deacetylase family protein [Patescibacteria group bacterium]|nr:polysaccharide deacetylase family protein [Patescibacteria group bacterium]